MSEFKTGDSPADHTVAEVVAFLKGDECTPDEYDRVMQAEREAGQRVGIISLSGVDSAPVEQPADPEPEPDPEPKVEPEPEPDPEPVERPKTQTPAEAMALAAKLSQKWRSPSLADSPAAADILN